MKASQLRATIDKMVAESIRRQLPDIMNEVLLRTLASSGVMSESRREAAPAVRQPRRQQSDRPAPQTRRSLREQLFDETAGADFYGNARAEPALAQRYSELDPQLATMLEEVDPLEADGMPPQAADVSFDGLDFSAAKRMAGLLEGKRRAPDVGSDDARARQKFEEDRLARMRLSLNDGKPLE